MSSHKTSGKKARRTVKNAKSRRTEQGINKLLTMVKDERDKLAALITSIADEVWVADQEKRFTLVNPSAAHEFALAGREEIDIANLAANLEVYRPDGTPRPVEESPALRALRGEAVRNEEEIVRTPGSGELRYRQISATPVRDAEGKIIGSVSVVRDITDQVRMRNELADSQQRLLLATQAADLGIYDHDLRSGRITWDQRIRNIWGVGPDEEITYDLFMNGVHPDDRAWVRAAMERACDPAGTHKQHIEHRVLNRRDGSLRWAAASGDIYFDRGQAVRLIGIVQDITERKEAEEALAASRDQLQNIIDNTPDLVFVVDLEARFVTANRALAELLNSSPEQMIGRKRTEFMPETVAAQHKANDRRVIESGCALKFEEYGNFKGRAITFLVTKFPLRDSRGKICAVAGISAEITELKRMEERLREWNTTLEREVAARTAELQHRAGQLQKLSLQLSQAEERERRRIAVILHEDLQQHIAGAKFHLSLARSHSKDDRLQRDIDAVDTMLKEAIEKSRSLSRDLSPPVLHMNDLAEVLRWLAHRTRAQLGLNVSVCYSGDMTLQSEALATFLFRAAQELLFNVFKHAEVRDAAVHIRRFGRYVYLLVSDRGRGFELQKLSKTSGLGLFSIRERAELLGGRMKVKSTLDRGTRLLIAVPDRPQADRKPKERKEEERAEAASASDLLIALPSSSPGIQPLRVLLVDDHDVARAGLSALLRKTADIDLVGEARDGPEAINLTNDLQPDIVIMDASMALMSSDETTRQIKALLPKTRVIALSMYDEAGRKEKMFDAGADDFILKTVPFEELLAAIRKQHSFNL